MPQLALAPIEWTEEEYLEFEDANESKHEFLDGQVSAMPDGQPPLHNEVAARVIGALGDLLRAQRTHAMAGATPDHNLAQFNTGAALRGIIRGGPCRGFTSDQRIYVPRPKKFYTYPDGGIVCGERQMHPKSPKMVLTNPSLLFEVLSPRTAKHDRTTKLLLYRQLDSLQDVLLIDPATRTVEHHHRGPRGWNAPVVRKGRGTVKVLGGAIQVAELFEGLGR